MNLTGADITGARDDDAPTVVRHAGCERCAEYAAQGAFGQMFSYNADPATVVEPLALFFDVTEARELIAGAPRPPVPANPAGMPPNTWDGLIPEHVPHVPLDEPGIICPVYFDVRGEGWREYVLLIDGRHRAARLWQLGKMFYAHVLTPQEAMLITYTDEQALVVKALMRSLRRGRIE